MTKTPLRPRGLGEGVEGALAPSHHLPHGRSLSNSGAKTWVGRNLAGSIWWRANCILGILSPRNWVDE